MAEVLDTLPVLWRWVLSICGLIIAVGGAWAVVEKVRTPSKKLRAEVTELKNSIGELKENMSELKHHHETDQQSNNVKFLRDMKALDELTDSNRHMCGAMLALLDHMISGNSVDKMKEVRDEMRDFIIKKS